MDVRRLGRTGLKVSTICLGTMQFGWSADEATSFQLMSRAIELGCNFFDTADIYSRWVPNNPGGVSEEIIGRWLHQQNSISRHQLVLATKVRGPMGDGPNEVGLSRGHIMHAVEQSLRRLQTDYIDLYQVHFYDNDTPQEETLRALDDLVQSGKVRYLGCSNFMAWQLMKALWISDKQNMARYDSLQPHYNLVHRAEFERELQAVCQTEGVGVIPYSPLAAGFLTGKYRRNAEMPDSVRVSSVSAKYLTDQGFNVIEKVEEIAVSQNATAAQVAIAWVLANPTVSSVIIGANTLAQLEETVGGATVRLSAEHKTALDTISA